MRAAPTLTFFTTSGTSGSMDSFDGTARTHTITAVAKNSERVFGGLTIGTPVVPDNAEFFYHYTASSEL